MKTRSMLIVFALVAALAGCKSGDDQAAGEDAAVAEPAVSGVDGEIMPGLTARTIRNGYGRPAQAGDTVTVHYTGWLYDAAATDGRGQKFDSSVDRGEKFQFDLGAGHVIKGWDAGVPGMLIGETRELIISPELAYGDRGAGGVIPPGATLVFEVELFSLDGPDDAG